MTPPALILSPLENLRAGLTGLLDGLGLMAGGGIVPVMSAFSGAVVPSAVGGMQVNDGKGGMLAILHPRAMVFPASIAERLGLHRAAILLSIPTWIANTIATISNTAAMAISGVGHLFGFEGGGSGIVPSVAGGTQVGDGKRGMLAILHPREMVLPASIADPLKTALPLIPYLSRAYDGMAPPTVTTPTGIDRAEAIRAFAENLQQTSNWWGDTQSWSVHFAPQIHVHGANNGRDILPRRRLITLPARFEAPTAIYLAWPGGDKGWISAMIEGLTKEEFNRTALNTAVNPGLDLIGALARLEVARIRQQARSVAEAFEGFMHLRERGAFARSKGRHGFGLGYGSFWGFECFNSDGKLAWWEAMANLFPTVGFNQALDAIFVTRRRRGPADALKGGHSLILL